MKDKIRDIFFDIAKGVGIISVVLGHCCPPAKRFVYCYHLLLFFFISGFFYNKEKYEKDPIGNIVNKLKNNYPKYFLYSFILLIGNNLFFKMGIITTGSISILDFIARTINLSVFNNDINFAGALWFVPVMIYAISIFGVLVYISSKFNTKFKSTFFIVISSSVLGLIGLIFNLKKINLIFHLQTSILIIPVILLGYICKDFLTKKIDFKKYLTWYGFIISLILIIIILKLYPNLLIELSDNNVFKGRLFYFIVIIGLYMSLTFTKIISQTKYLSKHIAWIGKYSFEIMAYHFLMIKLVDFIYYRFNSNIILNSFPISEPKLWFAYLIAGIYGSLLLHFALLKFKEMFICFFNFAKIKIRVFK